MTHEELIRLVDSLEERAESYVTLEEVETAAGCDVSNAVTEHLLLVDFRVRADGRPVTLCRLNRRHPSVQRIMNW